ncbi:MAG: ABC transporter permease [Alphaproteobacteria bacterium]|nr:ABC transporter permease [Alphaproteobacteria bacterium]MDE2340273.1 ABC transporter permease [Alphaproteobacteria bacterium]
MRTLLLRYRSIVALFLVIALFAAIAPNFLSVANFMIMAKHVAIVAILGIGMTFVILTGGIDLSVGSIAGLAGMVSGALILNGISLIPLGIVIYPAIPTVILLVLIFGGLVGLANGVLVAQLRVAPFIVTLGMLYVARGSALLMSGGTTFSNLTGAPEYGNQGFSWLGAGQLLGIPVPVWLLGLAAWIAIFTATRTSFGRRVYAVGGNERAAELSGVRTDRIKIWVYVISGVCAALVGMLVASDLMSAHPASGESFELNAIAAVVLGGASLKGGRGTIGATLIGAAVIGVLGDGMVMVGVSEFWQMVIKGAVIIAAVVLDRLQDKFEVML